MTTRHPADMFHGAPRRQPQRQYEMPPPQIPIKRLPWFTLMLMGFAVVLLVGMGIGFWRAATPPQEPVTPQTSQEGASVQNVPVTQTP